MQAQEIQVEVIIESDDWDQDIYIPLCEVASNVSLRNMGLPQLNIELVILLTNNAKMQALNHKFRKKNKPTNVLSFPDDDFQDGVDSHLGDIAIGYEIVLLEAQQQNKQFKEHFLHLLIHGILHLLGYDHQEDADAEIMENLERKLLKCVASQLALNKKYV